MLRKSRILGKPVVPHGNQVASGWSQDSARAAASPITLGNHVGIKALAVELRGIVSLAGDHRVRLPLLIVAHRPIAQCDLVKRLHRLPDWRSIVRVWEWGALPPDHEKAVLLETQIRCGDVLVSRVREVATGVLWDRERHLIGRADGSSWAGSSIVPLCHLHGEKVSSVREAIVLQRRNEILHGSGKIVVRTRR